MRAALNDCVRALLSFGAALLGGLYSIRCWFRRISARRRQTRLRVRLRIDDDSPIRNTPLGAAKQADVLAARQRQIHKQFIETYCRLVWHLRLRRASVYVFAPQGVDRRLHAPYFAALQAPSVLHTSAVVERLVQRFGLLATRVFILSVTNPGGLHALHPSTLALFFESIQRFWPNASALCRYYIERPQALEPDVHALVPRIAARGYNERIERVATSSVPLPLSEYAPAVACYMTSDAADTTLFLERLRARLPAPRYRHVPLHATTTPLVQTLCVFHGDDVSSLPASPGVLYELADIDAPLRPMTLRAPWELVPGHSYSLVVSDVWGLLRHDTGDVFSCEGFIGGLPDLRFARRREPSHAFAGENISAAQLAAAYAQLRQTHSTLLTTAQLTCIPSAPTGTYVLPHYRLIVATDGAVSAVSDDALETLAGEFERSLCAMNADYAEMRREGVLAAPSAHVCHSAELCARLETQGPALQPLYLRTWEELWPADGVTRLLQG